MTRFNGIFYRILAAFSLFTAGLSLVIGIAGYFSAMRLSDELLENRSSLLLDIFIHAEKHARSGREVQLDAGELGAALDLQFLAGKQIPSEWQSMPDGFNTLEKSGRFVLMKRENGILYAISGSMTQKMALLAIIDKMLFFCAVSGLLAAFVLAFYLSARLSQPLRKLARHLRLSKTGSFKPARLDLDDRNDEIGVLSRAINSYQLEAVAFIEREKFFTSAASHELRTPLTVLSNGLEILEDRLGEEKVHRELVQRLMRTCSEMKGLLEGLLCLARGERQELELLDIQSLFLETLQNFTSPEARTGNFAVKESPCGISLACGANAWIQGKTGRHPANARLAVAVFRNLLENAIKYGKNNDIFINFKGNEIEIRNARAFRPGVDGGPHFGLLIASRACARMNWQIEQDGNKNETVFTVRLAEEDPLSRQSFSKT